MKTNNSHIKLKTSPCGIISLLILYFLNGKEAFFTIMLCAAVHEAGHLAVMKLCGCRPSVLTLGAFNLNIKYNKYGTSYKTDILISAAGAASNIIFALISFYCGNLGLFYTNIVLAVINLLPADGLDGGNILKAVCALRKNDSFKPDRFDARLKLYGRIFAPACLCMVSILSGFNVSVVFTGVSALICKNINAG